MLCLSNFSDHREYTCERLPMLYGKTVADDVQDIPYSILSKKAQSHHVFEVNMHYEDTLQGKNDV